MKRSTNLAWAELRVGMLLVAAVLAGTVATVSFSGIRDYFRPTFTIHTQMADVGGLKPGALVTMAGVRVGTVSGVTIAREGLPGVAVDMDIFESNGLDIRTDATTGLGSQGLLGDKHLVITAASSDTPLVEPGAFLAEGTGGSGDITDMLGEAGQMTAQVNDLLTQLRHLVDDVRSPDGTVGALFSDRTLYDTATGAAQDVSATAESARKAIADTAAAATETARDLGRTADAFHQLEERLEKEFLDADGTLQRLAKDGVPFAHFKASVERLDVLLQGLEQGEGTLGKLLREDHVAEELAGLLTDVRELVAKIDENPKRYFSISIF